jgi:hypothetical protein
MSLKELDKSHNELIKMLERILEKKNRKTTPIRKVTRESELIYNKKKLVEIVSKTGRKYKVNQKVASKIIEIQTVNNNKLLKKPRLKINNKDPIKLMESCGMKKSSIQKAMLKKAKEIGGDNKDSQYLALERLLGVNKQEPILEELEKTYGEEKSL